MNKEKYTNYQYLFLDDINKSMFDIFEIKGYQLLLNEKILRLFSVHGCVDLGYPNEKLLLDDYEYIEYMITKLFVLRGN